MAAFKGEPTMRNILIVLATIGATLLSPVKADSLLYYDVLAGYASVTGSNEPIGFVEIAFGNALGAGPITASTFGGPITSTTSAGVGFSAVTYTYIGSGNGRADDPIFQRA
jgi:hypothetical protein